MDSETIHRLLSIAASQHSIFTTAQAEAHGVSREVLRNWARNGRIARMERGIWTIAGVAPSPDRRAQATLLAHGRDASLCRSSAAWVWDVPGHELDPVQVIRRRDAHLGVPDISHTSRRLDNADLTERRGLLVTTPTRTIFDLAAGQHPDRTRRDLNALMACGLITLDLLDENLDRLAARGRAGITTMRELIAEAHEKGAPAGSNLELRVEEMLRMARLRTMQRQLEICDDAGLVARVDFGEPDLRIVIEVDSDRFHHGLLDRQIDEAKTSRLEAVGWTVLRISEREIWYERDALLHRLRRLGDETRRRPVA
jgi:very-short-patch-repair endonuclease